jgi:hypothetical protein
MSVIFLIIKCGLFEPEINFGSLVIVPVKQNSEDKIQKALIVLGSVHCIVKKSSNEVVNLNLTLKGDSFHGEIDGLEPGSDYTVILYGMDHDGNIILRGLETEIVVSAGKESVISLIWSSIVPILSAPADGDVVTRDQITLIWNELTSVEEYEIEINNDDKFVTPLLHIDNIIDSYYTIEDVPLNSDIINAKAFFWRVRAKDSENNCSGWSEVWNFSIIETSVDKPTFNPLPDTYTIPQYVEIRCSTSDAMIHFTTNGSDPVESDPVYNSPVHISNTTLIKARAFKSDWTPSDITSGTYTIKDTVAKPNFNLLPGTYTIPRDIKISCSTSDAKIHYTINGEDPTEKDLCYRNSIHISSTTTLKARAYKNDWEPSDITGGTYTITGTVESPFFHPLPGTYTTEKYVEIRCPTPGAILHYTTNGSIPTTSDPVYCNPIQISSPTALKARAFKNGWSSSEIVMGNYNIEIPVLLINPDVLYLGLNKTVMTFYITNYGSGTLKWNLEYNQPWLTIDPVSGNTTSKTDEVYVVANRSGLTPDNYNGWIGINSNGGNDTINVTMKVDNIQNELIAHYKFNGNANDETKNEYNGTIKGAVMTEDRFGNLQSAYKFDGMDDYINDFGIENPSGLMEFTYTMWYKTNDTYFSTVYWYRCWSDKGLGFRAWNTWSDNMVFELTTTEGRVHPDFGLSSLDGFWHHAVATYDGNQLLLYLDGVLVNNAIISGSLKLWSDAVFGMGRNESCKSNYYKGNLDEVRIYNYALNESEIEDLYNEKNL